MKTFASKHRRFSIISSALLVMAAVATVALAQGTTPPKLTYAATQSAAPAGPATAVPGPTTFVATAAGKAEADITVVKVHDGTDVAALQAAANKSLTDDQIEAEPFDLVGGTAATKGHPGSVTITLVPGTYLVVNTTKETKSPSSVLTVAGAANGAVAPTPTTSVSMLDYKYELTRSLPANGNLRVTNNGKRVHMMIPFKAANQAGAKRMVAALKKGKEKAFEKEIRGGGPAADPISPGQTVDIPVHYSKGTYVLVCFWQSKASKGKPHFALGMAKIVPVK